MLLHNLVTVIMGANPEGKENKLTCQLAYLMVTFHEKARIKVYTTH